jgi:hypothetical protein
MRIPNIKGLASVGKTFFMANRPEILLGASLVSSIGGAILAGKGGYEARGKVDAAEVEKGEPLDVKEKIQLTWLCYLPAAITVTTAVGSIGGLHLVHVKEKKALATAAMAAIEEIKKEAKEFEKENLGILSNEEKNLVLEERANKAPTDDGHVAIQNTDGEITELYLVRDPVSGRDIWSNKARIEEAIVEVGNIVNGSDDASLNSFYEHAGFGRLDSGEELGWSGVIPWISWTDESGNIISGVRDDGRPWRGFRFSPDPKRGYDDNRR